MTETRQLGDGRSERPEIALLAVFFIVLTVLFTYPISTAPGTYLKDLADSRLVTWTLAWNAHALATDPLNILDANIYFPSEGALAWSETFLAPSVLVAPLNWAGYPVLAYNLVLLSSFVLSGLGAALWVRHMTGSLSAGLVAGIVWAFAPGKFAQVAHLHMMVGQWIPFALWFCGRYIESGRLRDLYATIAFVVLQFGFSMHYGVYMLPLLAIYALLLFSLLPTSALRENIAGLRKGLAAAAVVGALLAVALALPFVQANRQVGLGREAREMARYSARPWSFLSGSPFNRAPHARWLFDRYEVVEANYFPGLVPLLLATGALLVVLPGAAGAGPRSPLGASGHRELPETGDSGSEGGRATRGDKRQNVLFWLSGTSAILAAAAFVLHVGGIVAAYGGSVGMARIVSWNAALHPALCAALLFAIALLTIPGSARRRLSESGTYMLVVGYLTVLAYLLAYGPAVQAFGETLGHGPYWLLHRFLLPFQMIRSVGRIGLLWILGVAALSGFAIAHAESRFAARGSGTGARVRGWGGNVFLVAVIAVLLWEYRVWPLPYERADPAADPADTWLAEQPGEFAVIHAPIGTGRRAWTETAYMLGSTLHWKRLVNGYARFVPATYRNLTATPPLEPEFFRRLRADFPVRYLLVHEDRLANEEQRLQLRRLVAPNDDAVLVAQFGYTLVFEVPPEGGPAEAKSAAVVPFRFDLRRSFSAEELTGARGAELALRGLQPTDAAAAVALGGWGGQQDHFGLSSEWETVRFDLPDGLIASGGGGHDFTLATHTLLPVGETGARVASGFTVDAQRSGTVMGLRDQVFHESERPSLEVHRLEEFGIGVVETRTFEPTPEGATQMLWYIEGIDPGVLVAAAVRLERPEILVAAAVAALRLLGAEVPGDEEFSIMVVLGARGADRGTAMMDAHHDHAVIDIEGPTPVVQVRDLKLY